MQRFKTFLTEAVNYEDIFNSLWKAVPQIKGHELEYVKDEIKWARAVLKKQDRIVWYLQWIRLALLSEWGEDQKVKDREFAKVVKANVDANDPEASDPKDISGVPTYVKDFLKRNIKHVKTELEHFFSMEVPQIHKHVFTNYVVLDEIRSKFKGFEEDWAAGHEAAIPYNKQPLEHHDPMGTSVEDFDGNPIGMSRKGISIIKQFPHDYYWVNLKKTSCRLEADAMGHCGNSAANRSYETVLSFRKLVKRGKDEKNWLWEPHLTFILDTRDGFLGEMKGRANEKPTDEYHKYIVALLLDPMIKGIRGGGYEAQNNFHLDDLQPEVREKLFDKKPILMDLKSYFKKFGKDETLIQKINAQWENLDEMALVWDDKHEHAAIAKFHDVDTFVEDYGNDTAKWVSKQLSGDRDYFDVHVEEYNIQEVLDIMNDAKVEAYLQENYPEEWEDDDGDSSTLTFIENNDPDFYDALSTAARYALETGAEDDMSKHFRKALEDDIKITNERETEMNGTAYIPKEHIWDEPMFVYMSLSNLISLLTDHDIADTESLRFEVEVSEPYYGYSGWSEETAKEQMKESYPELM